MRYYTLIKTVLAFILLQILLSGCYTQFGLAKQDDRYDAAEYYEDEYVEDAQPVIVHHHYIPRPHSVYFYYDPYDYWYYESDVIVTVNIHRPYWGPYYHPPYVYYPHPYWHHPPSWRYPVPFIVHVPGYRAGSTHPNFGRRPSNIAGRQQRSGSGDQDAFFGGSKRPGRRGYANISSGDKRTQRRTSTVSRRSSNSTTNRKVTRRSSSGNRDQGSFTKPSSSSSKRRITSGTKKNRSSSSRSKQIRSARRTIKSSGSKSSGSRVTNNRSSSGNSRSFSKPSRSSGSSGSKSSSSKSSSGSNRRRR